MVATTRHKPYVLFDGTAEAPRRAAARPRIGVMTSLRHCLISYSTSHDLQPRIMAHAWAISSPSTASYACPVTCRAGSSHDGRECLHVFLTHTMCVYGGQQVE